MACVLSTNSGQYTLGALREVVRGCESCVVLARFGQGGDIKVVCMHLGNGVHI